MKERIAFEKWAMPRLERIQKILLLEHFTPLTLEYSDKMAKDVTAEFAWTHPYQSLCVRYSSHLLEDFKSKKFSNVDGVLVHELAHALTDPLYDHATRRYTNKDSINDEREKLTDHIANIVLKNTKI